MKGIDVLYKKIESLKKINIFDQIFEGVIFAYSSIIDGKMILDKTGESA